LRFYGIWGKIDMATSTLAGPRESVFRGKNLAFAFIGLAWADKSARRFMSLFTLTF